MMAKISKDIQHFLDYKFDDQTIVVEMEIETFEAIKTYIKELIADNERLVDAVAKWQGATPWKSEFRD